MGPQHISTTVTTGPAGIPPGGVTTSPHRLNRAQMEALINQKQSIMHFGRVITRIEDLPSELEIAVAGGGAAVSAAEQRVQQQIADLQKQLADLHAGKLQPQTAAGPNPWPAPPPGQDAALVSQMQQTLANAQAAHAAADTAAQPAPAAPTAPETVDPKAAQREAVMAPPAPEATPAPAPAPAADTKTAKPAKA